ncbi:holo-ACP synthase [Acholeplasma vituli]|uniref:Holo-[acyl-carrier-protein] synthase n=1 Tax=Paracholeplasma vituli TaxID=69473 RepID=A0ABT2PXZ3_9MOLU|nr:holo-ACP synthase [Paracholeplasma vituli]MCU0105346.1 holo-ACP synthase [Paracholeplasma vituli]
MMKTGIDLVEIERIEKAFSEAFVQRILAHKELEYFHSIHNEHRKMTFLAGRFAAKEALFKALKQGDLTLNFKDICILNDAHGAPYFEAFPNRERYHLELSISHTDHYAVAIVLLEIKE